MSNPQTLPAGRSLFAAALLTWATMWLACSPPPKSEPERGPTPPTRVLLITIDTLRADHLGAYGHDRPTSPYLDELASRGTLFERAFVQWPKTGPSFASMFTGLYPGTTGLKAKAAITLPAEQETLAELFRSHGYSTVAVVGNAVLDSELGWSQGYDEYIEPWSLPGVVLETPVDWKRALDATQVTAHAIDALERYRDSERLFAWIHYMDPHIPYVLPPGEENPFLAELTEEERSAVDFIPKDVRLDGRTDLAFYKAQYDANIAVADRWIETLMERAGELGLLEDTLVVVTSDHGESLGERRYFGHGAQPYNNTLHVPLIFFDSERVESGLRVAAPVELIDLYPTLEQLLTGRRPTRDRDGESLVPFLVGEGERAAAGFRYAYSEAGVSKTRTFRTVQDDARKLVFHPGREEGGERWELYELDEDPREKRNLVTDPSTVPEDLRFELGDWIARTAAPSAEDAPLDPQIERALRALGYVD